MRLQKIDSGSFRDHYYLEPSDHCYYVGEFTPYGGYSCSPTNQLIHNLKKSVSLKGTPQYVYKGKAIAEAGGAAQKGAQHPCGCVSADNLCAHSTVKGQD